MRFSTESREVTVKSFSSILFVGFPLCMYGNMCKYMWVTYGYVVSWSCCLRTLSERFEAPLHLYSPATLHCHYKVWPLCDKIGIQCPFNTTP